MKKTINLQTLGKLGKFLSKHKGKSLIGAGLLPVAYLAWKKRDVIGEIIKGKKEKTPLPKTETVEEALPIKIKFTSSRKTDLVNTVRFMLSQHDTKPFKIAYCRSRKQGYMGYYIRAYGGFTLFFGWSDEFEKRYPETPFWIALNPQATNVFREKNLKIQYDIYANPRDERSILISLPFGEMENPKEVSAKILELARATLV